MPAQAPCQARLTLQHRSRMHLPAVLLGGRPGPLLGGAGSASGGVLRFVADLAAALILARRVASSARFAAASACVLRRAACVCIACMPGVIPGLAGGSLQQ